MSTAAPVPQNNTQDNENAHQSLNIDTTMTESSNTNTNTNANTNTRQQDSNRNNSNSNSNMNLQLSTCITCQCAIYMLPPPNSSARNKENDNEKNASKSSNNVNLIESAPFARQCMHRECSIRKTTDATQCEKCSQVSCCRGCCIILCQQCRNMLKVLQCGYHITKKGNSDNNNNNNHNNKNSNTNNNDNESKVNDSNENVNENVNVNEIEDNHKSKNKSKNEKENDESSENDYSCNAFICSHSCYKKIIFKYTILLKSNGFDSQEHVSLIQLKKMFMKPFLTGLYETLMLPQAQIYQELVNEFDKNSDTIVNANDINWNTVDKNDWFPFHECQGCKKYNCGCTEWICCVNCRKYYCQECGMCRVLCCLIFSFILAQLDFFFVHYCCFCYVFCFCTQKKSV